MKHPITVSSEDGVYTRVPVIYIRVPVITDLTHNYCRLLSVADISRLLSTEAVIYLTWDAYLGTDSMTCLSQTKNTLDHCDNYA